MNQINTWHDCTLSADCRMGIRRASGRRVCVLHPKKSVTHMKEAYVYRRGAKTNKETMNGTLASNLLLGISAKQFHFISLEILYSHNFASFFPTCAFSLFPTILHSGVCECCVSAINIRCDIYAPLNEALRTIQIRTGDV